MEALAVEIGDPIGQAAAHVILGTSHHLEGDQAKARFHFETSVALVGDARPIDPQHFAFHGQPPVALCRVLWLQGYPDQAIKLAGDVADVPLSDPFASIKLMWTATVYRWVGDWAMVDKQVERLMAYTTKHFMVAQRNVGLGLKAEMMIQHGRLDEGISLLRRSIARLDADRYRTYASRASLAHGLAAAGDAKEAMGEIDVAIDTADSLGTRFIFPELLRIKGEICAGQNDAQQAQSLFERAFAMAGQQSALSWQLRIATSMLRLAGERGSAAAARKLLADTYGRFTEGFATADVQAAKQLLESTARARR
jgi:tetratricopeptide (TPR) repeat protein